VWIIDPLDGTNNYLHGFPFYSISIAVRVKNRIEHAVVYDPVRYECFTASRGCGARLNECKLRVTKQMQLSAASLGTNFSSRNVESTARYLPKFNVLFNKCKSMRCTGSAALNLAYVASGRLDGFWELGLRLWDIAAGCLLIQESGGLVSDLNGGEGYWISGDLVAGTPRVFKALLQELRSI
jgi:myo-inositol-1(or 4)-monophosphatase